MNYRLYSFVANHYISPLQCGLQTAHVVSEMATAASCSPASPATTDFHTWAREDKTIIICGAGNHKGVRDCYDQLYMLGFTELALQVAIFHEDLESMNCMATACGVIVPEKYWNVEFFEGGATQDQDGKTVKFVDPYWEHGYEVGGQLQQVRYPLTSPAGQFISHIKQYRLA